MGRQVAAIDPQRRAAALRIAAEHGAAAAGRETGVKASTIRAWRSREGAVDQKLAKPERDIELDRMAQTVQGARGAALEAVEQIRKIIPNAKSPQSLSISVGVLTDKASQIEQQIQATEQHHNVLIERFAEQVAEIIRVSFAAVGLRPTAKVWEAVSEVPADVLRRLTDGSGNTVITCSPAVSERATAAVREHFRTELEVEIRAQILAEQKQLPAPVDPELPTNGSHPTGGADPDPDSFFLDGSEEVVDAVVVVDSPVLRVGVGGPSRGPDFAARQPSRWAV